MLDLYPPQIVISNHENVISFELVLVLIKVEEEVMSDLVLVSGPADFLNM